MCATVFAQMVTNLSQLILCVIYAHAAERMLATLDGCLQRCTFQC